MLFHDRVFFVFFLVVFAVYLLIRRHNGITVAWLGAASYVFYGWWNWYYLILIAATTTVDWFIGLRIGSSPRKKWWLAASVVSNLGLLAFFKYADFAIDNLNVLLGWFGATEPLGNPAKMAMESLGMKYLLPVGISFFTFQSMSYTIDVYRGQIPVERSLLRFATFVSLFPQLVAGPIERASNLLPQLYGTRAITMEDVTQGLSHFLVGLFKKVALADYLALYVDKVYNAPGEFEAPALLLATFAFAWQIYFDFSGYTDMARGVAQIMGFRLMLNFNNPYVATGLGDFWGRWHISLSTWFKDYVYFPLGGNRGSKFETYRNMVATMLISGFWHGAAWGFIIWGALHAAGRVVTRELELTNFYQTRVPKFAKQMAVFVFVCFTWIFFRGRTWEASWTVLSRIFTTSWTADPQFPAVLLFLVLAVWAYQFLYAGGNASSKRFVEWAPVRLGLAAAMVFYLAVIAHSGQAAFIYFDF
jgi:D-alanyl-lipoteichoic acid acyltransferase DltB (MBOAT superfamily)